MAYQNAKVSRIVIRYDDQMRMHSPDHFGNILKNVTAYFITSSLLQLFVRAMIDEQY